MPTEVTNLPDGAVEVFLDADPVAFYNHETCVITWNPEIDALAPHVVNAIEALTGEHDEQCANDAAHPGGRWPGGRMVLLGGWLDEGPVDDGVATVAPMEWAPVLVHVNPDGSAAYLCEGCATVRAERQAAGV